MVMHESGPKTGPEFSPELLIDPVKEVVEIAMEKLKQGYYRRGGQRVSLMYEQGKRIYDLSNFPVSLVTVREKNMEYIRFVGSSNRGLFISCIQLDKGGNQIDRSKDIELPRNPQAVTATSISHLTGTDPDILTALAKELQMARKYEEDKYPRR